MPKHPAKNHTAPKGPKPKRASAPARCPGTKGRPGREAFLPVSRADMEARGWDQCDFVYVCGDAYVTTRASAWRSSPACSSTRATA